MWLSNKISIFVNKVIIIVLDKNNYSQITAIFSIHYSFISHPDSPECRAELILKFHDDCLMHMHIGDIKQYVTGSVK